MRRKVAESMDMNERLTEEGTLPNASKANSANISADSMLSGALATSKSSAAASVEVKTQESHTEKAAAVADAPEAIAASKPAVAAFADVKTQESHTEEVAIAADTSEANAASKPAAAAVADVKTQESHTGEVVIAADTSEDGPASPLPEDAQAQKVLQDL